MKADIKQATRKLRGAQKKQIPYATSRALNDTAYQTMQHAKSEAKRRLHKPTRSTLKGIVYKKTNKRDLVSKVFISSRWEFSGVDVAKYLGPNIVGGSRELKRSEKLLRNRGILPAGKFLTPAPGWTNAAGNLKPGVLTRVLSQLSAFQQQGYNANISGKSKKRAAYIQNAKFYVIQNVGIFTRRGGKSQPVLFFADRPTYRVRYPFKKITMSKASRIFPALMRKHLKQALRTAK
jgi:hypothetical protein